MSRDLSEAHRVLVFTATFNEVDNIDEWLERITSALPHATVLVIDDASPDGTAERIRSFSAVHPHIVLLERPGKLGLGSAHKLAFSYALEHSYDVLITMDADLSHEPEEAPLLLEALDDADFAIGTRWGAGTCDYTGFRKFVSWSGNKAAKMLLRAPVSEYTTSFRALRPEALRILCENPPKDDGYAFFMEVVIDLHRSGISMVEVPIHFRDRAGGESKIPKSQILVSSLRLLQKSAFRGS